MSDLTHDAFLGGRVHLWQPRAGYRAGVDPVILAAACEATPGQSVLDLGCGVGAAMLCLGERVAGLSLVGLERQADYAALARRNAGEAGQEAQVFDGDLAHMPGALRARSFDHVIANPPYYRRGAGSGRDRAADAGREAALGEETPLAAWVDAAARRLAPRGRLTMILRADRLDAALSAVDPRLGGVMIRPIAPRAGRDASLFLLSATKGGRAPLRLLAPAVMHEGAAHTHDGESYTPEFTSIFREAAPLVWD